MSLRHLLNPERVDWSEVLSRLSSHPEEALGEIDTNASESHTSDGAAPVGIMLLVLSRTSDPAPPRIIRRLLELNPRAVRSDAPSHGGWSALHSAARFGCSQDVVRALVDADPSALALTGDFGETPLHVACRHGRLSPAAAEALFDGGGGGTRFAAEAARRDDSEGCVPLHYVRSEWMARMLLRAHARGVRCRNEAGRIPLHEAAANADVEPGVVRVLLEEEERCGWKCGAFVEDNALQTPLDCLFGTINRIMENCGTEVDEIGGGTSEVVGNPYIWDKMKVLVPRTLFSRVRQSDHAPLLHLLMKTDCPITIIQYALATHPEQAAILNDDGMTPLCIAVSSTENQRARKELIELLLDPDLGLSSASAIANADGCLPLHLAAESGLPFNDGMEAIIKANPKALDARDGKRRMYPFQVAAVGPTSDLNLVFALLREKPDLLL